MSCAVLALLCLLQQVVDTEPPHLLRPPVFSLSLHWACLLQSVMLSGGDEPTRY